LPRVDDIPMTRTANQAEIRPNDPSNASTEADDPAHAHAYVHARIGAFGHSYLNSRE
jgi:hypothetical protein